MDHTTQSAGQQQQQRQQPVYDPNNNGGHYGIVPFPGYIAVLIVKSTVTFSLLA